MMHGKVTDSNVPHRFIEPTVVTMPLDISGSMNKISDQIGVIKPDIIINLVAMTNVDLCETEKELADRVNHLFVKDLDRSISQVNPDCFILQVSTDYVFDGQKGNYAENDETNPLGWYGLTKLRGEEELIHGRSRKWCIVRTSTPFGIHEKKQSFPVFVAKNLIEGKQIKVLKDQRTSPTYCQNLAEMLFDIVSNNERFTSQIIHASGSSQLSRFEQATMIARELGFKTDLIHPSFMTEMNWKAKRPKDSTLNVAKASDSLLHKPQTFIEGLQAFSKEFQMS